MSKNENLRENKKSDRNENLGKNGKLDNDNELDNTDPQQILRNIKINNLNRLVIGQININGIANKIDALR